MKTLNNHIILYDAECPMCGAYTQLFVRTGMLHADGRVPYQQMPSEVCHLVDRQRAVNEIALVNTETGQVEYGIRSLFKVIGNSFPVFRPLFSFGPFIWLMSKLYAFISYNRKVIIPAPVAESASGIQPAFRLSYRILYLLCTVIVASIILSAYAPLFSGIIPTGNKYRELLVCGGQLLFQGVIITMVDRKKLWDYLGNMMTISFAGALLLLPVLFISGFVILPQMVYAGYFMLVAGLMLLEHIRRSGILAIGKTMTIGWVVYRVIILLLIIQFA